MAKKMTMMLALALANSVAEGDNGLPTEGDFAVLTVAWLLWRRCRPFFSNAVAAACVVVVFVVVVARPLSVAVCAEGR